jgi:membrane protein
MIRQDIDEASRSQALLGGAIALGLTFLGIALKRREQRQVDTVLDLPPARNAGRTARQPTQIPRHGWSQIVRRVFNDIGRHNISLAASGVAFYGLLALFPGLAALVSLYGLIENPTTVNQQVASIQDILPQEATAIIDQQLQSLTSAPSSSLSIGLVISVLFAIWSARSGASSMMIALNIAYQEEERRGILRQYAIAFAITISTIVFSILALVLIALVPAMLAFLPLPDHIKSLLSLVRWPILAVLFMIGLSAIYRVAPSRTQARWAWVSIGAIVATVLWLLASCLFSFYVAKFGSYDKTYGSLGAVIVLLMWFYLSAFAILIGAEINAEAERQTVEDSTVPPDRPLGERGAYAADTVAGIRDGRRA